MAVRLQLKLGAVTEQDRLPDSPDAIIVVEPSVGSVARTKGNLYVLVTSRVAGNRAREAARLTAETIRNEYYYDESAGIRGCLIKAITLANKRLGHQRDRYGLGHHADGSGPIGIGVAVVRANELYVATVGPTEAYLIRQARLSTLPDPHRDRGLPYDDLEPDVWRGELSFGDSLCLVSANVVARLGTDELKDALVTLHPQSAIEHLHGRFVAADGQGSDGAIALEATEVGATAKQRTLVPVRPAEPLAGKPDRGPIPLADPVADGVAAIGAGAVRVKAAAGGAMERGFRRVFDFLPRRRTAYRRVTPLSDRREVQRRAAVAFLAFVTVVGGLVAGVWAFGGQRDPGQVARSQDAGQQALTEAREALARVSGPGVDLIANAPDTARELLTRAIQRLDDARRAGVPASTTDPLRKTAAAGLDRLYGVVPVTATPLYRFGTGETPHDLVQVVRGPDQEPTPYILDRGAKAVYRIDITAKRATPIYEANDRLGNIRLAEPRLLAVGGRDLLILDANNQLYRWRSSNTSGRGTLVPLRLRGSAELGDDILAMATFLHNAPANLYRLYLIDVSEQQLLRFTAASDGGGFPTDPDKRLPANRPVDKVTDLFIDGNIFTVEDGEIIRVSPAERWDAKAPPDSLLRPAPDYRFIGSGTDAGVGSMFAYDAANARVIELTKRRGDYVKQYRLAGGDPMWKTMRDLLVLPPVDDDAPATIWWIGPTGLYQTILTAVPDVAPSPSPSGSADPSASGSAPASTEPSAVP